MCFIRYPALFGIRSRRLRIAFVYFYFMEDYRQLGSRRLRIALFIVFLWKTTDSWGISNRRYTIPNLNSHKKGIILAF